MEYLRFCKIYERLEGTSSGLKKTDIVASFLKEIANDSKFIYLLRGKLFADFESKELGISGQLVIRAIARVSGIGETKVIDLFKKMGDLGKVAEEVLGPKKKQRALFESRLSVEKVMANLQKLPNLRGEGAVEQKIGYVTDLLLSAEAIEAKYIVRTILGDLKIGIGAGILRDAIVTCCFAPEDLRDKKICAAAVQEAYDKATDFAEVFDAARHDRLEKIKLGPEKPLKVMLFPKAKNIEDAFRIVGRPAAFEYKYDGFRVMVNKTKNGEVKIFTRALEDVTAQFPEIVECARSNIKGDDFIVDGEAVGYSAATGEYTDFQMISQRIRRKHGIDQMRKSLPVELVLFDIVYLNGENLISAENQARWKILESVVDSEEKRIVLARRVVSENVSDVEQFYNEALADGQEGLMGKRLDASYKPGARVGHAVKLKPEDRDFDLVITGAEWGTGKRAGWLTSFDVACRNIESSTKDPTNNELLGIGRVSTGLKELKSEGLSFEEMTDLLEGLVIKSEGRHVVVRPKIIVSVQFQNIQRSSANSSGFGLRFPRVIRLRPDRGTNDIATVEEIEKEIALGA
jgi:DNA ligase 1